MRTPMIVVVWLLGLEYVTSQPLSQPAVPFNCDNIRCEREGFYACVGADIGEPACYPCKMKLGTCGTINEFPGCNLFCEDQLIKKHELIVQTNTRTNLGQNVLIQKLTKDNEKLNDSVEEQSLINDQLSSKIESLKLIIRDNNVTIRQMTQRITLDNSTIREQSAKITQLTRDNKLLNHSIEAQIAIIRELHKDHADSKPGYSGSITELYVNMPLWLIVLQVVFAISYVVLVGALVVTCINHYRLRKTMKPKYESKADSDASTPLSPPRSRDDSGVSLELEKLGESKSTVSSDSNTPVYSSMPDGNSSSNIPDSCSGTDDCYGKRLQQCPPTNDQGNNKYQFSD